MLYRPDIDGLRAVAVLSVILFHAGFGLFSGGFVGVDVFFVISGYLITGLILEEMAAGTFSLRRFYARRARRILPALFVVVAACIPFAWMWLLPVEYKDFAQSIKAVVLFYSNILFYFKTGYFEPLAEEKPLLHTWSLAVEEQFYIFFPLLMILLWRLGWRALAGLLAVIAVASLALAQYQAHYFFGNGAFFLAPVRIWELLAGALAALALRRGRPWHSEWLPALGLAMIAGSIFLFDVGNPWPSLYTLAPVTGTVLLVMYGDARTRVGQVLSVPVLTGIGLISYSAYLWHQPLFAFAHLRMTPGPPPLLMAGLAVLSLVLAWFTWKYVETPFRRAQGKHKARHLVLFVLAGAALVAAGWQGDVSDGRLQHWLKTHPEMARTYDLILRTTHGIDLQEQECRFYMTHLTPEQIERLRHCRDKYGPGIVVFGDSHATDLFGAISSNQSANKFLVGLTQNSCRPHTPRPGCEFDRFVEVQAENGFFDTVIYTQAGFYLLQDTVEKIRASAWIFWRLKYDQPVMNVAPYDENIDRVISFLETLGTTTAHVIWVGPHISHHISVNTILKLGCDHAYRLRPGMKAVYERLDAHIAARLERAGTRKVRYLSQVDMYEFNPGKDILNCERTLWFDEHHWNLQGQKYFGRFIVEELGEAGVLAPEKEAAENVPTASR